METQQIALKFKIRTGAYHARLVFDWPTPFFANHPDFALNPDEDGATHATIDRELAVIKRMLNPGRPRTMKAAKWR